MAVDWDTWQQQMRQGGFGTTAIPGLDGGGMASPATTWAGWELGQPQQMQAAPQQTTNWGQVPAVSEAPAANPWAAYQSGNPFGMEFSQDATPAAGEVTTTVPGGPTVASASAPQPWLTETATPAAAPAAATGGDTTANWFDQPGWKPPMLTADEWREMAARTIRAGWGLQDAHQNGGLTFSGKGPGFTLIMPTDYDSRADTMAAYVAGGGNETALQRVIRWTADEMAANPRLNPMQVMAKNIRRVDRDAKANGQVSGFNLDKLGGQGYGAWAGKVDPNDPQSVAAQAAPGGNNVSVPGYDPGTGGGGTVPGQAPGGAADPLRNQALANNQALRTALLLDKLGLGSPMARRNMFTGPVGEQLAGLMDPWMRTQGLQGGDPAANYEGMIGKLAGYFGQGGGGISSIAGDARQAAQQAAGDPRYAQGMDADLLAMLTGFNQLATQGQNPWLQKAYGTLRDDLAAQYSQYNLQPGNLGNVDLLGFIQKNPLFNFMTGR